MSGGGAGDTLDKLVVFLAKRDGIDKLVKTYQYVSKLAHWAAESSHPGLAGRAKSWETAAGLSRKVFRSGRSLTGLNALRRSPGEFGALAVLANAGEMVYFFFDHFTWLSRVGVLEPWLARRASFVSAFGECVGYVFFIVMDFIMIRRGIRRERALLRGGEGKEEEEREGEVRRIRADRVMRLMGTAANLADLVIAVADIEPNPFCNHAVTLGISGLVSAWAGWYRNWPS
ncbi:peroxisomal membrane protein 11-4 [Aegilops tauschii subsp. strangulata]|uniref:Peroxisomal membrane protein 11-4 n=2 Tax=Aegilops tauschii subsp. strangulata TaxID=200361 RepID=A0A453CFA6_AEGTS|nr:peroxisomal membrane protein 11-4 [Aegilops tauschii subsp. strangulata]